MEIADKSSLRPLEYGARDGDNLEEIDDCLYSLDSDPRSDRRPSGRNGPGLKQIENQPENAG